MSKLNQDQLLALTQLHYERAVLVMTKIGSQYTKALVVWEGMPLPESPDDFSCDTSLMCRDAMSLVRRGLIERAERGPGRYVRSEGEVSVMAETYRLTAKGLAYPIAVAGTPAGRGEGEKQ